MSELKSFVAAHPEMSPEDLAKAATEKGYKCNAKTVSHYRYLLKAAGKSYVPKKEQVAVLTPKGAAVVLLLRNGYVEEAKALAKL